jgi:hypothetical protein
MQTDEVEMFALVMLRNEASLLHQDSSPASGRIGMTNMVMDKILPGYIGKASAATICGRA